MLILTVHVTIQAGREEEVEASLRILQEESRRESGCLAYVAQRSRENPRRYLIYEQYKDPAALDVHRNSEHFKQYATNGFYRFVEQRQAELFDPL
jgi:autoinducer 2-degrading protein